jgi:DNA/RNA endonuclease YhcR with UshA esterase domain
MYVFSDYLADRLIVKREIREGSWGKRRRWRQTIVLDAWQSGDASHWIFPRRGLYYVMQKTYQVPACLYPALVCFLATFSSYVAMPLSAMAAVRVLEAIPADQAQEHIGETTTVCGLVASARYIDRDPNRPTYLNFDHPYPNQTFAVMIPDSSRAEFNGPPEVVFNGKTVCVTGLIVEYRGKPGIVVESPYQIVVQEAEPATASEATPHVIQKAPTPPPPNGTLKGISSAQAQRHIGETTTVCGLVASARYMDREQNKATYLNFDYPYPNQTFAVTIPGPSRAGFKEPPEVVFNGKTVCVTGLIVEHHGKPGIVVENPSQIVIQK